MCFYYDDQPEFSEIRRVKTRVGHKCEGCRKAIQKGSVATCYTGKFDGAFYRYYACDRCQRIQYAIVEREIMEGCNWSTAWCAFEDLKDYLYHAEHEVRPLGMPTLQDCTRYLDDLWLRIIGYGLPEDCVRLSIR